MYAPYFGLGREPFSLAPDPRFLFMSERHREALAHLLYGLGGGGGFVVLTGEIGAGKTTVARCFLEQLPAHCTVAYIYNPRLTVLELLQTICAEFGLPALPAGASAKAHVDALNAFLLKAHAEGRQALLVIDEAQALDADVLEQLRLLTNLETAERKLLQIVLIGQPELREMLARPGLEQLSQRIVARYHLGPLSAEETRAYIEHRLAVAGPNAPVPFDAGAIAALHRLSRGVPRRVNLLADRALLGAYGQSRRAVDRRMVERAAQEVFGEPAAARRGERAPSPWLPAVLGGLVTAGVALALAGSWPVLQRAVGGGSVADAAPAGARAGSSAEQPPAAPRGAAASAAGATAGPASAAGRMPAMAVAAGASAPVAQGSGDPLPLSEPADVLAAAHADDAVAWRELALRWNVAIGEGEPCTVAAQAQLACFATRTADLRLLRQLDRPVMLTLAGATGPKVHVLLVALGEDRVTVQVGSRPQALSMAALATLWRGEMATFWRTPPGWPPGARSVGREPPVALRDWVLPHLGGAADAASASGPRAFADRLAAWQLLQGLPASGVAGPQTLMLVNRVAGVDEPRLGRPQVPVPLTVPARAAASAPPAINPPRP